MVIYVGEGINGVYNTPYFDATMKTNYTVQVVLYLDFHFKGLLLIQKSFLTHYTSNNEYPNFQWNRWEKKQQNEKEKIMKWKKLNSQNKNSNF